MTRLIKIYGIVQGVGFRPFTARLARSLDISGSVSNRGSRVEVLARASSDILQTFVDKLRAEAPPRAHIIDITVEPADDLLTDSDEFSIIDSARDDGSIFVSPDIAVCSKCRAELFDRSDRRYLHPFINCTDCGPRLTILRRMPYDRERTSMSEFPMCDECAREYFEPSSRRYDAQPVCCNRCGPTVYVLDGESRDSEAISLARRTLIDGGIVALKGIGGFHLACDATNHTAVERLRRKKFRPTKPFAVMFRNIDSVRHECVVDDNIIELLDGHQKPIVLLDKMSGTIADNVAPFNRRLGVMLPYTPLHLLLFYLPDGQSISDALVMTSGNVSGAPIARTDDDARRLRSIADLILSNDRDILIRADDSVVHSDGSMIRRSRGYAPLPIRVDNLADGAVLAIGAEIKNTFCLARDNLFCLSPYVGDLSDLHTVEVLKQSVEHMIDLLEIDPTKIVCDLHPRYHSSELAEQLAERRSVPLIKVQHHHAHILSCMAENNRLEPVIGVAFDGTGCGLDGSIWGGEILIAGVDGFDRFASIEPFTQAGGDRSSVDAWRSAVSMLATTFGLDEAKKIAVDLDLADEAMINGQFFMLKNNINCVRSTSAGRLFDAISSVLGLCSTSTFEGEAAARLMFAAESSPESSAISARSTREMFAEIVERRLRGESVGRLARAFHVGLSEWITSACSRARVSSGLETVALSGGVFHNELLTTLTTERLRRAGFDVLRHHSVPANDGGLALGQALAAASNLKASSS